MRLWSYHGEGFSLVDGEVDWSKSSYYKDLKDAYHRLEEEIGTDQLIWCVVDPTDWGEKGNRTEWELEVPEDQFLAIIDTVVWEHQWGAAPNSGMSQRLRDKFGEDYMERLNAGRLPAGQYRKEFFEEEWQKYKDSRGGLILESVDDREMVCVLLEHPVPPSWVIKPKLPVGH